MTPLEPNNDAEFLELAPQLAVAGAGTRLFDEAREHIKAMDPLEQVPALPHLVMEQIAVQDPNGVQTLTWIDRLMKEHGFLKKVYGLDVQRVREGSYENLAIGQATLLAVSAEDKLEDFLSGLFVQAATGIPIMQSAEKFSDILITLKKAMLMTLAVTKATTWRVMESHRQRPDQELLRKNLEEVQNALHSIFPCLS